MPGSRYSLESVRYFVGVMTSFTVSAALSIVFLVAALPRSTLPSRSKSLSPVTSPTASFNRPFMSSPAWSPMVLASSGRMHRPFESLYPIASVPAPPDPDSNQLDRSRRRQGVVGEEPAAPGAPGAPPAPPAPPAPGAPGVPGTPCTPGAVGTGADGCMLMICV